MKALVETIGPIILINPRGEECFHNRPTVIHNDVWVGQQIACGQLRLLSMLPMDATDEEFAQYWEDSKDHDLAVASFLSKYHPEAEPQLDLKKPAPTPTPTPTPKPPAPPAEPKK